MNAAGFADDVPELFKTLYSYAWFVGLFVAAIVYLLLCKKSEEV